MLISVLRGLTGLSGLALFVGMIYFGFILMRIHAGKRERVFFWATIGQVAGVIVIMTSAGLGRFLPHLWSYASGVNWTWVGYSLLQGLVLLCSLLAAVALVASAWRKS